MENFNLDPPSLPSRMSSRCEAEEGRMVPGIPESSQPKRVMVADDADDDDSVAFVRPRGTTGAPSSGVGAPHSSRGSASEAVAAVVRELMVSFNQGSVVQAAAEAAAHRVQADNEARWAEMDRPLELPRPDRPPRH